MEALALPYRLLNSWVATNGSTNLDFILKEEIVEWLEDNEISVRISYVGGRCEEDWYEYTGHFDCFEHAVIFKTRWF